MRMDRRAGLLASIKLPTLDEVMADMSMIYGGGTWSSSVSALSYSISNVGTDPYYLFACVDGDACIARVTSNSIITYLSRYGTMTLTVTSSAIKTTTNGRLLAVLLMRFPSFDNAITDRVFRKAALAQLATRSSSSAAIVSFAANLVNNNALYMAAGDASSANARICLAYGSAISTTSAGNSLVSRYGANQSNQRHAYMHTSGSDIVFSSPASGSGTGVNTCGMYQLS